jgi:rhodanese-related sulfurtransferase
MSFQFNTTLPNPYFQDVTDVLPAEVYAAHEQIKLIDVRETSEFSGELGHVPGAELIVLSTLPEHIQSLPTDRTLVFICRSGGRSAQAAAYAKQQGFKHVHNMQGGMLLWNQLQLPIEK